MVDTAEQKQIKKLEEKISNVELAIKDSERNLKAAESASGRANQIAAISNLRKQQQSFNEVLRRVRQGELFNLAEVSRFVRDVGTSEGEKRFREGLRSELKKEVTVGVEQFPGGKEIKIEESPIEKITTTSFRGREISSLPSAFEQRTLTPQAKAEIQKIIIEDTLKRGDRIETETQRKTKEFKERSEAKSVQTLESVKEAFGQVKLEPKEELSKVPLLISTETRQLELTQKVGAVVGTAAQFGVGATIGVLAGTAESFVRKPIKTTAIIAGTAAAIIIAPVTASAVIAGVLTVDVLSQPTVETKIARGVGTVGAILTVGSALKGVSKIKTFIFGKPQIKIDFPRKINFKLIKEAIKESPRAIPKLLKSKAGKVRTGKSPISKGELRARKSLRSKQFRQDQKFGLRGKRGEQKIKEFFVNPRKGSIIQKTTGIKDVKIPGGKIRTTITQIKERLPFKKTITRKPEVRIQAIPKGPARTLKSSFKRPPSQVRTQGLKEKDILKLSSRTQESRQISNIIKGKTKTQQVLLQKQIKQLKFKKDLKLKGQLTKEQLTRSRVSTQQQKIKPITKQELLLQKQIKQVDTLKPLEFERGTGRGGFRKGQRQKIIKKIELKQQKISQEIQKLDNIFKPKQKIKPVVKNVNLKFLDKNFAKQKLSSKVKLRKISETQKARTESEILLKEFQKQKTKLVTVLKTEQKVKEITKTKLLPILKTKQEVVTITKTKTKTFPVLKTEQEVVTVIETLKEIPILKTKQEVVTITKTIKDIPLKQKQLQKPKPIIQKTEIQTPPIPTKRIEIPFIKPPRPKPPRPPRPKPPRRPKIKKPTRKIRRQKLTPSFPTIKRKLPRISVLVRRKGKFVRIPFGGRDIISAFKRGADVVSRTAAASFKVKKEGKVVTPSQIPRGFKRSKKDANILVEINRLRINTLGELREITFKGLAAQRDKRIKI